MSFLKVSAPEFEPACCRMCSAVAGRDWFVDLCYVEDFWGRVYYCNICFDELAVAAEYAPKTTFQQQKDQYYKEIEATKQAYWETSGAVDLLRDAGIDIRSFYNWVRSVATGETNIEFPERKNAVASGKDTVVEPGDGEGPDDATVLELSF